MLSLTRCSAFVYFAAVIFFVMNAQGGMNLFIVLCFTHVPLHEEETRAMFRHACVYKAWTIST